MPRISTFVYCESVQNDNTQLGPKSNIISPMSVLRPMFIPGTFSFSIFISMLDVKFEETHIFRIVLTDGIKDILDTKDVNIPVQNIESDLPESERGFMFSMDFRNVVFENEGSYTSKVYFDNMPIGEYPIYVKAVKNVKNN